MSTDSNRVQALLDALEARVTDAEGRVLSRLRGRYAAVVAR